MNNRSAFPIRVCEPYEIQTIGAFIAYLASQKAIGLKDVPLALSLYQQSPLDSLMGDLAVGTHRFFALEFKRGYTQEGIGKEREKWRLNTVGWLSRGENRERARSCHFMIYGKDPRLGDWSFAPFFDEIFPEKCPVPQSRPEVVPILVKHIVDGSIDFGMEIDYFREYMWSILRYRVHGTIARLVMSIIKGVRDGIINWRALRNLSNILREAGDDERADLIDRSIHAVEHQPGWFDFDFLWDWRVDECDAQFVGLLKTKKGEVRYFSLSGLIALMFRLGKVPAPENDSRARLGSRPRS